MKNQEALKKYWDIIFHYEKYAVLQDEEGRIKVMEGTEDELPTGTITEESDYLISLEELHPKIKENILLEIKKLT